MNDEGLNYAMAAACAVIWPEAMQNCTATEMVQRCETMKKAFDAAFATGAIGMYEKVRGIPKEVPDRIIWWIQGTIDQIELLRMGEHNVSRRVLLTQLFNMSDSAQAALRDARKHNANIKS